MHAVILQCLCYPALAYTITANVVWLHFLVPPLAQCCLGSPNIYIHVCYVKLRKKPHAMAMVYSYLVCKLSHNSSHIHYVAIHAMEDDVIESSL